jgi:hypothetical protein
MYDAPDIVSMSFKFLAGFIARVPASPPRHYPGLRLVTQRCLYCRLLPSMPSHHDSPRDVFIRIRCWRCHLNEGDRVVQSCVKCERVERWGFEESARYAIPILIRKNNLAPCSLRLIGSGPYLTSRCKVGQSDLNISHTLTSSLSSHSSTPWCNCVTTLSNLQKAT